MTREEELHLFSQIKLDDRQALERLFNLYYNTLCNFAFTFVRNFDLAQEVVADVFYIIWRDRKQLVIQSNLKGYLFKSVKNKCLAHPELSLKIWQQFDADNPDHDPENLETPESNMLFIELDTLYQSAYKNLPSQCQLIFKLHKIDGLKYSEISDLLSLSTKTIEAQMSKALRIIRKVINSYQTEKH